MPGEYRDRATFDRAVWQLVDEDVLFVIRHNYPASLTPQEREDMLTDPEGACYAFVAQRG